MKIGGIINFAVGSLFIIYGIIGLRSGIKKEKRKLWGSLFPWFKDQGNPIINIILGIISILSGSIILFFNLVRFL
jgi:hypothetical protein